MSGFQDINIVPLIHKYGLVNFIETGCYTGDGIRHAFRSGLYSVYSCDINNLYVKMCKQQFPDAIIEHAHSAKFLLNCVDYIAGPTLFWLDAHFPELYGEVSKNKEEYFPLIEELKIISQKPEVEKDVIIVDDIRVLISDDNPIKQEFDDKYKIHGTSIKDLTDLFPQHNSEVLNFQEGLLFLTPKDK